MNMAALPRIFLVFSPQFRTAFKLFLLAELLAPLQKDALFGIKAQANDLSNLNIIRHKLLQFVKQFTAATFE